MNTDNKNSKISNWVVFLGGYTTGLIILFIYRCQYSQVYPTITIPIFWSSALLVLLTTSLAAAPLIRFVILGWDARYHEFVNRLNNEALIAYLQQFWEKRATQDDSVFVGWDKNGKKIDGILVETTEDKVNNSMEKIFKDIYTEQYGRRAFYVPIVLLITIIFILTVLSILLYLDVKLNLHIAVLDTNARVAIASIAGAYMYVVSDTIQSVRQRSLNASTIYWYVLRMLLAIPIGFALTYFSLIPLEDRAFLAFALGALPLDEIIKLLRHFSREKLNPSKENKEEEKSDQLIKLEGVTTRISSLLIAEGVDSIEQIITVDPVLLSIRTGLPFKFILHLGSQAIVRRYLGETVEKLMPLGLADARSIAALVDDLDNTKKESEEQAKIIKSRATAVLNAATSLVKPENSNYTSECLEFNFRQIANGNYTKFIQGKLLTLSKNNAQL
ncbi:MAG: hypothetical protein NTW85_15780 [Methylococcales bacterium]|nr:hypothetical protein [Methylococcales bacterium]